MGIHANGVAAECLGRLQPLDVILHGLTSLQGVRVPKIALAIAHDQQGTAAMVAGPLFQGCQVLWIPGLVLEELIDIFQALDAESVGNPGKIQRVQFRASASKKSLVQRPLCQGNLEGRCDSAD